MKKILITGAAGFVGYHLSQRLLSEGHQVYGIDNLNDYYDPNLKLARLRKLGLDIESLAGGPAKVSKRHPEPVEGQSVDRHIPLDFQFQTLDLQDQNGLNEIFNSFKPDMVINLAAQAGVRYSLENPRAYIQSNIDGFFNIIEACRQHGVKEFIYASSSSVYGNNEKSPFAETDRVDYPVSLYAATKKSNELIAHTYSHLYKMTTVGLRFFTVYGPWGRPDMAYYFFTKAILAGETIKLFNQGLNLRDYTYIDDIVESITRMIPRMGELTPAGGYNQYQATQSPYHHIFNIGGSQPVPVHEFVDTLEDVLGKKAITELVDFEPGDVFSTQADTSALESFIKFKPSIPLKEGLSRFITWYKYYHKQ